MGCYERAVPDPPVLWPERPHRTALAAGIFASRAAARELRHRSPTIFSFALSDLRAQRVVRVVVLRRDTDST